MRKVEKLGNLFSIEYLFVSDTYNFSFVRNLPNICIMNKWNGALETAEIFLFVETVMLKYLICVSSINWYKN